MNKLIESCRVWRLGEPNKAIIVLPGRDMPADILIEVHQNLIEGYLDDIAIFGFTPYNLEWYPAPKGPLDQDDALNGQKENLPLLFDSINYVLNKFNIHYYNTIISGHSAGGVMVVQLLNYQPWAGAICNCGAILDPDDLKTAKYDTELLVTHNIDDTCFDWEERYIPMKQALKKKGYNTCFIENEEGNHSPTRSDFIKMHHFIKKKLC